MISPNLFPRKYEHAYAPNLISTPPFHIAAAHGNLLYSLKYAQTFGVILNEPQIAGWTISIQFHREGNKLKAPLSLTQL